VTLPFQDFAGMNVSVALLLSLGIERIQQHLHALKEPVREWAARRGVAITSPEGDRESGILCVQPPRPAEAHRALRAAGITCSLRESSIRLSPHCYNTVEEMARVVEVLEKSVKQD
jgi:selenocysteine lyase/cysteine desulfurase